MALSGIPTYGRMTATPIRANDVAQPIEALNSPRLSLMLHFTQSPADRLLRQPQVQLPAALATAEKVQRIDFHVGRGHGAAYEVWLELGRPQNLTRSEEEAFRLAAEPSVRFSRAEGVDGAAYVEMELAPWEFAFVEVSLPGTPSKELAEEETAGALNDHLSYRQAPAE